MKSCSIDSDGIYIQGETKKFLIPWIDIEEVRAYRNKKGRYALAFKASDKYYQVDDLFPEWNDLVVQLPRYLIGSLTYSEWIEKLKVLPWDVCEKYDYAIFERSIGSK
jgi:hypothetical protein